MWKLNTRSDTDIRRAGRSGREERGDSRRPPNGALHPRHL